MKKNKNHLAAQECSVADPASHHVRSDEFVSLSITERCNINCSYCFARKGGEIPLDRALEAVNFAAANTNSPNAALIAFGGEPLLRWDLLKAVILRAKENGIAKFSVCSNAILINDEKIDFFMANDVDLLVSIDGVADVHDLERVTYSGRGTFDLVKKRLDLMRKRNFQVTCFRFSVTPRTAARLDEAYAFVTNLGFTRSHITTMPVAGDNWTDQAYQSLRSALLRIAEIGYKAHREGRYMPFRYNECLSNNDLMQALFPSEGRAESCMWGEKMMGVSSDGGVYPCYILPEMSPKERDPFKMGSLDEGIPTALERRKLWNSPDGRNLARSCHVWNALVGGDPFRPLPIYKHFYRYYIEAAIRLMSLIHPENAGQYKEMGLIKLKEHL